MGRLRKCAALFAALVLTSVGCAETPSPRFDPLSISFLSDTEGFVLGTDSPCPAGASRLAVRRTVDGGVTWHEMPAIVPPPGTTNLRFVTARDGWARTHVLWATHDGGLTWRDAKADEGSFPEWGGRGNLALRDRTVESIRVSRDGVPTIHRGGVGGGDWVDVASLELGPKDMRKPFVDVAGDGDRTWIWAFERESGTPATGAIWDGSGLARWTPPCSGPRDRPVEVRAPAPATVLVACGTGDLRARDEREVALLRSTDGGESFTGAPLPADPAFGSGVRLVAAPTPRDLLLVTGIGLWHSGDGGQNWSVAYKPDRLGSQQQGGPFISYPSDAVFRTPSSGFLIETRRWMPDTARSYREQRTLLRTEDAGKTWTAMEFDA
ncbi:sialidase family protein [Nocardia puris]|uniref:BNR/Asp-box repeat protein n=1 Tax=Nocardia puris TaxID=208602 RepID=A0A366DNA4_9NOCA|nr:hypothetical protein [Nocardia puris]RBO91405.1 hypothetical protein DFR74_104107 [Nocardia puris]